MLTDAAARFVSPLALEVVSGHPVGLNLWQPDGQSRIVHTDAGQQADLILVAPATANLIGKLRHGLADDLVTTTIMASTTPVLVCPSMNTEMLNNPIVADNIASLVASERYHQLAPGAGELACGVTGPGRLPDPPEIINALSGLLGPLPLQGVSVVVTAGPTREPIDPVRFISNRSTGTMGFELARALSTQGASVTLIAGPVNQSTPPGLVARIDVETAAEMATHVEEVWPACDVLVMTAAVADMTPSQVAPQKLKKQAALDTIPVSPTRDILAATATWPGRADKRVIGFAAETADLEAQAREKLTRKALDAIIANDVSAVGVGFGSGDNAGLLLTASRCVSLERAPKRLFAERLVSELMPLLVRGTND